MNIQSLSITVPTGNHCVNKCPFCVSRTHTNLYEDRISQSLIGIPSLEYHDYFNRLQFARDNGCNVAILTGTGEPLQNILFLNFFRHINSTLQTPFKSIELQTTGVLLTDANLALLRKVGVTTISFSVSDLFDNDNNLKIIRCINKLNFDLKTLIQKARVMDFNIRLSLNMLNVYDHMKVEDILEKCVEMGADQVTFRQLYSSNYNIQIDKWIMENESKDIDGYIRGQVKSGKYLGTLPFGAKMYEVNGMSMVYDDNCMSETDDDVDAYKYLILRENCKLYSRWETKASLVF